MISLLLAALALADDPLPLPELRPRITGKAERLDTTAFRTFTPAGAAEAGARKALVTSVTSRIALVEDFDGPFIGELTLRGQLAWHSFGLGVEVAGTAGASTIWSGAGIGNTILDFRGFFGRGSTHALGIRGTLPTGDWHTPAGTVGWWGTVPRAIVPTLGAALAYEGALPRWVWHVHVGFDWRGYFTDYTGLDADVSIATIQPFALRWFIVGEVELLNGPSPLHVRALVRHEFQSAWTADVGVAAPVIAMIVDPTLQVLVSVRRTW